MHLAFERKIIFLSFLLRWSFFRLKRNKTRYINPVIVYSLILVNCPVIAFTHTTDKKKTNFRVNKWSGTLGALTNWGILIAGSVSFPFAGNSIKITPWLPDTTASIRRNASVVTSSITVIVSLNWQWPWHFQGYQEILDVKKAVPFTLQHFLPLLSSAKMNFHFYDSS